MRELSTELQARLFNRRVTAAHLLEAQLTEPAYDRLGGDAYGRSGEAMALAQRRFFELYRDRPDSPERQARQADMMRAQDEYERIRRQHAPAVQTTIAKAMSAHWSLRPMTQMPDACFADAEFSAAVSRLARIHPVWWGRCFGQLQSLVKQGHPAHGELFDALPRLTTDTGRCTIEGAIYEWRKSRNDRWGWYRNENHRVLAKRAMEKAEKLTRWYRSHAPGFLEDADERQRLHTLLTVRLAEADPRSVPAGSLTTQWHGPN